MEGYEESEVWYRMLMCMSYLDRQKRFVPPVPKNRRSVGENTGLEQNGTKKGYIYWARSSFEGSTTYGTEYLIIILESASQAVYLKLLTSKLQYSPSIDSTYSSNN